jgi:hypothetical protein
MKPPASALVSGAALVPRSAQRETDRIVSRTLNAVERELGGREELLRVLDLAPVTTPIANLRTLLANPANRKTVLAQLALRADVSTGEILKAYQAGVKLYAQTLAAREVAIQLPQVTKDVMARALPQHVECLACHGSKKDDDGKKCLPCHGKGWITEIPDLDRQQVALELGDLMPKKGGGNIAIGITNNPSGGSPNASPGGFLETLQQAVAQVLYTTPSRPAPIEAEIVPPDPARSEP